MEQIYEAARSTPIWTEVDLCVLGGSCTGLFAAIRAARLGLRVAVVEKQNCFGGTACSGLVNVWHSLLDTDYKQQIIAGLTAEVQERMLADGRISFEKNNPSVGARLDPNYLKYVLDRMAIENNLVIYLHTWYSGIITDGTNITHVLLQNKDGRGAIRCGFVIDATGDGDVLRDAGIEQYREGHIQPPSSCFFMTGLTEAAKIGEAIRQYGAEYGMDDDWGWYGSLPGFDDIYFRADNHVFDVCCDRAADLTRAEIEGRKKAFAFEQVMNRADNAGHRIVALCSALGIRETVHYRSNHRVTDQELLLGTAYDDCIMKGTYRVDVHHANDNGITFKYLDGTQVTYYGKDERSVSGNWRKDAGLTGEAAKFYQMPYRALTQNKIGNLLFAGRMIDAEPGAFGALRVMVNTNQMGEAAGVAAYLSLHTNTAANLLDGREVRQSLIAGGSALE